MAKRFASVVMAAAMVAGVSFGAQAQTPVPRLAGKPNFSGIWTGGAAPATVAAAPTVASRFQGGDAAKKLTRREQGLKDRPLTAWGREAFLYYTAGDGAWQGETGGATDPRYHGGPCGGPKGPADLGNNLALYQTPKMLMVTSLTEQPWIRKIWIGQTHPADLTELVPFWMGHSVGRWEGDTLVVDTVQIKEGTPLSTGRAIPQSGHLRMTERFSFGRDGKLQIERTYNDPVAFTRPWSEQMTLMRDNDSEESRINWEIQENHAVCKPTGGYDWGNDDPWFDNFDKLAPEFLPDAERLKKGLPPVPPEFRQN